MRLAICTTACGRSDLTRRTLQSFMTHNPVAARMSRFLALDHFSALEDQANVLAAHEFGWEINAIAIGRSGLMWGMRELVRSAIAARCDQMLWLENDWECVRSLADAPGITEEVDCIRLYGDHKQSDLSRPAGRLNMVTGLVIPWQDCGEHAGRRWESARAHFGGAPSIIDLRCLAPFTDRPTMKDMAKAMGEVRTLRPRDNYFWHIGNEGTPGFVH